MTKCFVCDGRSLSVFKKFNQRDHLDVKASGASRLSTNLVRCSDCGHVQQEPVIDPEVVSRLYSNTDDEGFVEFNSERIASFKKAIRRIGLSGVELSGSVGLDVGCGGGAFPFACKDFNVSVDGVEPSSYLSDYARSTYDINVKTGFLEDVISELRKSYGFISFWDVLEHIYDINSTIDVCKTLLKKSGFIIINVPAVDSWPAKLMKGHWPMYLDVHVQYFNEQSLTALMDQHGFSLVSNSKYYQTLPIGYILYRGLFHVTGVSLPSLRNSRILRWPFNYYIGQRCFVFQSRT